MMAFQVSTTEMNCCWQFLHEYFHTCSNRGSWSFSSSGWLGYGHRWSFLVQCDLYKTHIICKKLLFWILPAHKKSRNIYYDDQNIFLLCVPAHTGLVGLWRSTSHGHIVLLVSDFCLLRHTAPSWFLTVLLLMGCLASGIRTCVATGGGSVGLFAAPLCRCQIDRFQESQILIYWPPHPRSTRVTVARVERRCVSFK